MRLLVLSLPVLALGLLAGCQTGDVARVVPISGGGQITVPLTRDGLKPGEADGYVVSAAVLNPGKETREAFYTFGLTCRHEPALKRVQIDDISDETAASLIDEAGPKFENRVWKKNTEVISADDARMKWVFQITPSMRVYRFTLTRQDDSKVTFNHVTMYPPVVKAVMRNHWGEKY